MKQKKIFCLVLAMIMLVSSFCVAYADNTSVIIEDEELNNNTAEDKGIEIYDLNSDTCKHENVTCIPGDGTDAMRYHYVVCNDCDYERDEQHIDMNLDNICDRCGTELKILAFMKMTDTYWGGDLQVYTERDLDISYPDEYGIYHISDGESITVLYFLQIIGFTGAHYSIQDEGAILLEGNMNGILDYSGRAEIVVAKTYTQDDIEDGKIVNTATITPGVFGAKKSTASATIYANYDENVIAPQESYIMKTFIGLDEMPKDFSLDWDVKLNGLHTSVVLNADNALLCCNASELSDLFYGSDEELMLAETDTQELNLENTFIAIWKVPIFLERNIPKSLRTRDINYSENLITVTEHCDVEGYTYETALQSFGMKPHAIDLENEEIISDEDIEIDQEAKILKFTASRYILPMRLLALIYNSYTPVQPELEVDKTVSKDKVHVGDEIVYNINVINTKENSIAKDVNIIDYFPADLEIVKAELNGKKVEASEWQPPIYPESLLDLNADDNDDGDDEIDYPVEMFFHIDTIKYNEEANLKITAKVPETLEVGTTVTNNVIAMDETMGEGDFAHDFADITVVDIDYGTYVVNHEYYTRDREGKLTLENTVKDETVSLEVGNSVKTNTLKKETNGYKFYEASDESVTMEKDVEKTITMKYVKDKEYGSYVAIHEYYTKDKENKLTLDNTVTDDEVFLEAGETLKTETLKKETNGYKFDEASEESVTMKKDVRTNITMKYVKDKEYGSYTVSHNYYTKDKDGKEVLTDTEKEEFPFVEPNQTIGLKDADIIVAPKLKDGYQVKDSTEKATIQANKDIPFAINYVKEEKEALKYGSYQIVHQYYTDDKLDGNVTENVVNNVLAGKTIGIKNADILVNTKSNYNNKEYELDSCENVKIEENKSVNVIIKYKKKNVVVEVKPVSINLSGDVKLENATMRDKQFSFRLKDGDKIYLTENNKSGNIKFNSFNLDKEGTYRYTVTQDNLKEANVKYDTSKYEVEVKVTKENDKLVSSIRYYKDETEVNKIEFKNVYEAPKTSDTDTKDIKDEKTPMDSTPVKNSNVVSTGDATPIAVFVTLFVLSAVGIIFFRKKKN